MRITDNVTFANYSSKYCLVELDSLEELFPYTDSKMEKVKWATGYSTYEKYLENRTILCKWKKEIFDKVQKQITNDPSLQEIVNYGKLNVRGSHKYMGVVKPISFHVPLDKAYSKLTRKNIKKEVKLGFSLVVSATNGSKEFESLFYEFLLYTYLLKKLKFNIQLTVFVKASNLDRKERKIFIYKTFDNFNSEALIPILMERGLLRVHAFGLLETHEAIKKYYQLDQGIPIPAKELQGIFKFDLMIGTKAPGQHVNHVLKFVKTQYNDNCTI